MEAELTEYASNSCDNFLYLLVAYVLPFLQVVAMILNSFNAFLFAQWKNPLYRYLCANSTVDTIWLVLSFSLNQTVCTKDINVIVSISFQYFQLLIPYLIRVVGMVSALIKIQIAFDRYFILTKGYIKGKIQIRLIRLLAFFLISIAFFATNFLIFKVYKIEKCTNCTIFDDMNKNESYIYFAYFTEFVQKHVEIKFIYALVQYMSILICVIIIIILNVLLYNNFQISKAITNYKLTVKYYNNENSMELFDCQSDANAKKIYKHNRITLMVFWISSLFIIDQILTIMITTMAFNINQRLFKSLINILHSIISILNTFFYYKYYNEYRKILKSSLKTTVIILLFFSSVITGIFAFYKNYFSK